MQNDYWANAAPEELAAHVSDRIERYGSVQLVTDLRSRYARAYRYYYGLDPSGVHATSQVLRGGEQGELAEMRVNHCRPLVNTLLNLIVSSKVVWTPKAVNIDYESLKACKLASAVLEYYWREKQVELFAVRGLEEGLAFTEGFVLLEWDAEAGDDHAIEPLPDGTSRVVKTGDVRFTPVSAWNVTRDPNKPSYDSLDWVIVTVPRNKFSLAAKYPQHADEIIAASSDDRHRASPIRKPYESDDVLVDMFFHRRTPAMPNGRAAVCLGDVVLSDEPLDGSDWPLYRVAPSEMLGTPFGYSAFFEILGVQELMDSLHTSAATNLSTFGTQNVAVEMGTSDTPVDQLAGGMRVFYYPQGGKPPQAMSLAQTPAELYRYLGDLKTHQELLIGLNSVVRGEATSGEQSGSALALLQSQALQQSSTMQANYLRFVESIGNGLLDLLRRKLRVETKVAIAGKSNQSLVDDTSYSGDSFERIRKVQVEVGNPLSQTAAGRLKIAEDLMSKGLVHSAEQYVQVLESGRLEPMTQGVSHELLLIRAENESLQRGDQPPVVALDEHRLHAMEHKTVLASLEARANPQVVQAVLAHIHEHELALYGTSPTTLMLVGQQPPMPMPPPPPPGNSGGPPPDAAPPGAGGVPGNPAAGTESAPAEPPINPATGEQWNPVDGGGVVAK